MKVIGLDSGSTTTKGVLFENNQIIAKALLLTAGDPRNAMSQVLSQLGYVEGMPIITTGYGRKLLEGHQSVTEITCHGKGAHFLDPSAEYVIDIGGQDSKVIRLDAEGNVLDFAMNDKCAAGTGRFVEVLMRTLGEDIELLDSFVENAEPVKINSMCTVFAESEVVSLVGKGEKRQDIALGVLHSIASRISSQFSQVNQKKGIVFFSGGLSQSIAVKELLGNYTKMPLESHPDAQFAGAVGAAIVAVQRYSKEEARS